MVLELHIGLLLVCILAALAVGLVVGAFILHTSRARAAARKEASEPEASSGSEAEGPTDPPPPATQVALIINPLKAAGQESPGLLRRLCGERGLPAPLVLETTEDDPGSGQAKECLEAGADLVIVAGGDGTVRLAAEQLAGTGVPMGIVPAGTGNLLARNLDVVLDRTEWALRTALDGTDSRIDSGTIRLGEDQEPHTFLVMAGLGFDAAVMTDVDPVRKSKVGWFAYVETGSQKLLGKRVSVGISVDGQQTEDAKVRSVVVGNCGRLQGGVWLLPDAEVDDGQLDLLVVSPKNLAQWVGVIASIAGKKVRRGLHTYTAQGETITVRAAEPVEVQIDGDPFGRTDFMELGIIPGSLTVRTPTPELRRQIRLDRFRLAESPLVKDAFAQR